MPATFDNYTKLSAPIQDNLLSLEVFIGSLEGDVFCDGAVEAINALAAEIERLNCIYISAVQGRKDFREAMRNNAWPIQAEGISLIIAENAEPKPENIPYLAVKIAEAVQTGNY